MSSFLDNLGISRRQPGRKLFRIAASVVLICTVLSLFNSGNPSGRSRADEIPIVRIEPSAQQVAIGNTTTTDVMIEDVTDLYGYEFQIAFDPALVEVVDACTDPVYCPAGVQIQPGPFLSPDWIIENVVDNDSGTIAFALSQLEPTPPQDGTGVLATITWRGKALGSSPIDITYQLLSGPAGAPIAATTQDGQITVGEVDLKLTKGADDTNPGLGSQVTFTLEVTNDGPNDATGVKVKDVAWPSVLTYVSDDGGGAYDPNTYVWNVGSLAVDASETLQIVATVSDSGPWENVAEVWACDQKDTDSTPANYPNAVEDDDDAVTGEAEPTAVTLSSFTASQEAVPAAYALLAGLAATVTAGVLWAERRLG